MQTNLDHTPRPSRPGLAAQGGPGSQAHRPWAPTKPLPEAATPLTLRRPGPGSPQQHHRRAPAAPHVLCTYAHPGAPTGSHLPWLMGLGWRCRRVPHCTARLERALPPGAPWLWELTHIVAWIWSFHLGLTVSLVWVWHRFQGTWLWRGRHLRKGAWPRASLGWGEGRGWGRSAGSTQAGI